MSALRLLVLGSVFWAASLAGFRLGEQVNPIESAFRWSLAATETGVPHPPRENQFNWLIINFAARDAAHPRLESVLLAIYNESTHKITFLTIFPSPNDFEHNQRLAGAFSLEDGKPSEAFWRALQSVCPAWWDGYVLARQSNARRIIDTLGGIPREGTLVDGRRAVEGLPSWEKSPRQSAAQRRALVQGLCRRLEQVSAERGLKASWRLVFTAPVDERFLSFLQIANLAAQFQHHEDFSCEFLDPGG